MFYNHLQPITDIHLNSQLARELQPNGRMRTVYIFSAAALLILLLAGINFVNLSVAQSAERAREMGMRKILGSTRRQLIAYLLGESCLFAFFAFLRPMVLVYEPQFLGCILVKAQPGNMAATLAKIQEKWNVLLPNYAFDYLFLDNMFARLYDAEQRQARGLGIFALVAIFIAALGILGLAAIAARQRRRELSIRKILGASIAQLVRLLSREFLWLSVIANLIAWPLAYWLMREWLQGFAYRVDISLSLFLLAGLLTLAVTLLAVSWHSIRAALVNPAETLRSE